MTTREGKGEGEGEDTASILSDEDKFANILDLDDDECALILESLATHAHDEQWRGWMQYWMGKFTQLPNGDYQIDGGYFHALDRQINLSYAQLTEQERNSDRAEARSVMRILTAALAEIYRIRNDTQE